MKSISLTITANIITGIMLLSIGWSLILFLIILSSSILTIVNMYGK